MTLDNDTIWRALASPQRRTILKALRDGPKTTTYLVQQLPSMTRFAVMKHINVLRDAGLVLTQEDGPRKINSLNAVPLRHVYEELVDGFQDLWARDLLSVKRRAESMAAKASRAPDSGAPDPVTPDLVNPTQKSKDKNPARQSSPKEKRKKHHDPNSDPS